MSIEKYVEKHTEQIKVQTPVDRDLYDRVNKLRKRKALSWPQLITALFKRLLDEEKG